MIKDHVKGLQHLGLPTNDIEKTIAFYAGLGFEVAHRTIDKPANVPVAFLRLKNVTIETYQNNEAAMANGAIDHIALDVDDVDAVFKEISKGGYTMLHKEVQFLPFWEHGVRFFTIEGPNHEKIEFGQML
jgi:lactoylglutathione lyase